MFSKACHSLTAMPDENRHTNHLRIAEAANVLGVSASTLRNWDRHGKLTPRRHPMNGYRIYDLAEIVRLKEQIEGTA